jgi:hypothetical protein
MDPFLREIISFAASGKDSAHVSLPPPGPAKAATKAISLETLKLMTKPMKRKAFLNATLV